MKDCDHLLQPFDERTLTLVRSAYQRAWPHLSRGQGDPSLVRNRLVGTLATLASGGIVDQVHLEREALRRISA